MSKRTRDYHAKKALKVAKCPYVCPVKPKPRELLWLRYKRTGARYEPFETIEEAEARMEKVTLS